MTKKKLSHPQTLIAGIFALGVSLMVGLAVSVGAIVLIFAFELENIIRVHHVGWFVFIPSTGLAMVFMTKRLDEIMK